MLYEYVEGSNCMRGCGFSAASLFVTLLGNRRRSSLLPEVSVVVSPTEEG